jgi:elongation factor P
MSAVYETNEIKKGLMVEVDGNPYMVVDFQFVNPGKGSAFYRTKMKNLLSGNMLDRTYKSGEKLAPADVEERSMEYIYMNGDNFVFMDSANYEQIELPSTKIGDDAGFLRENDEVKVFFYKGDAMSITLPIFVEVIVTETGPSDKGNTVTTSYKPALVSTGGTVQVPMFIKEGDKLKVDTRTKTYVERL